MTQPTGPPWRLPAFDPSKHVCFDPHVVLLGAGASLAALPDGDANGKRLPLMLNFVEVVGLGDVLDDARVAWQGRNFEEVFVELLGLDESEAAVRAVEGVIYDYFTSLRLPEHVTLYDELILSLRDKDVIATFNWDPLLLEAFRRNLDTRRLPKLLFLHGNVEVGMCPTHRRKGLNGTPCDECGELLTPVHLLYPVTKKNYQTDSFIKSEWAEFSDFLESAYLVTIFGYSAPDADIEARGIMKRVWDTNRTRELAQISIIDVRPEDELKEAWEPFFTRDHYGISRTLDHSRLFAHPRRSCDSFVMASLQQRPCHENPLPRNASFEELHEFIAPLIAEEDALEEAGTPFAC